MLRRILRWVRWAAPPAAFLAWAYRAYRGAVDAAIPAFGPPEPMVAAWRAEMFEQFGFGALLLALWVACWAWPGGSSARARGASTRPPARPTGSSARLGATSQRPGQRPGGREREHGRGLT